MRCDLCGSRQAKRDCPARSGKICPQCCGEKRVLEIDCPEECAYLIAGRKSEAADYARHVRRIDPAHLEKSMETFREYYGNVIGYLEFAIAEERRSSRDLRDQDVLKAIDLLLEAYRTEESGILYEKASEDLRIESLRRQLRAVMESLRNPQGLERGIVSPDSTRVPLGAAIACLEYVRGILLTYISDRHSSSGYVDFLARAVPRRGARSPILQA